GLDGVGAKVGRRARQHRTLAKFLYPEKNLCSREIAVHFPAFPSIPCTLSHAPALILVEANQPDILRREFPKTRMRLNRNDSAVTGARGHSTWKRPSAAQRRSRCRSNAVCPGSSSGARSKRPEV